MKQYTKERIWQYVEYCVAGYGKDKMPDRYYSSEEVDEYIEELESKINKYMESKTKDVEYGEVTL